MTTAEIHKSNQEIALILPLTQLLAFQPVDSVAVFPETELGVRRIAPLPRSTVTEEAEVEG